MLVSTGSYMNIMMVLRSQGDALSFWWSFYLGIRESEIVQCSTNTEAKESLERIQLPRTVDRGENEDPQAN